MRVRSARDWEWRRPCASSCRHESALTNTQRCGKGATRVERASVWATEGRAGDLEWRSRRQLAAVPDFRNSKEAQRRVQWSMLDLKQHRQHTIATCKNRGTRQPQGLFFQSISAMRHGIDSIKKAAVCPALLLLVGVFPVFAWCFARGPEQPTCAPPSNPASLQPCRAQARVTPPHSRSLCFHKSD